MKCTTGIIVYVNHKKTINKRRFTFYYTFTAKRNNLELSLFEVGTCEPFLSYHGDKRESRSVLFFTPGYDRNDLRYRGRGHDKPTFSVAELQRLRKLSDVVVPEEVWKAAQKRLKNLKV